MGNKIILTGLLLFSALFCKAQPKVDYLIKSNPLGSYVQKALRLSSGNFVCLMQVEPNQVRSKKCVYELLVINPLGKIQARKLLVADSTMQLWDMAENPGRGITLIGNFYNKKLKSENWADVVLQDFDYCLNPTRQILMQSRYNDTNSFNQGYRISYFDTNKAIVCMRLTDEIQDGDFGNVLYFNTQTLHQIWQTTVPMLDGKLNIPKEYPQGFLYASGFYPISGLKAFYCKLDMNGDCKWYYVDTAKYCDAYKTLQVASNKYIGLGNRRSGNGAVAAAIAIDSNGTFQNDFEFGTYNGIANGNTYINGITLTKNLALIRITGSYPDNSYSADLLDTGLHKIKSVLLSRPENAIWGISCLQDPSNPDKFYAFMAEIYYDSAYPAYLHIVRLDSALNIDKIRKEDSLTYNNCSKFNTDTFNFSKVANPVVYDFEYDYWRTYLMVKKADNRSDNLSIAVYPNPSAGVFQLKNLPQNSVLEVYDVSGKRLEKISARQTQIEFNIETKGLYYLKITDPVSNLFETHKILVE